MADSRITDFEQFWLGQLVEGVIGSSFGFGQLNEARPFPCRVVEGLCVAVGVFFDEATQYDVFFITLKKSERLFSPSTRYNDYAISPWEFHWESQSILLLRPTESATPR